MLNFDLAKYLDEKITKNYKSEHQLFPQQFPASGGEGEQYERDDECLDFPDCLHGANVYWKAR